MFVILLLYTTAPVICLTELGVKEDCERVFSVSHKRREFVCTSTRVYRGMFGMFGRYARMRKLSLIGRELQNLQALWSEWDCVTRKGRHIRVPVFALMLQK